MPTLVVGGPAPVLVTHHDLALGAEDDLLERVGEVRSGHRVVIPARSEQRGLVDEVGQVGADHSRCGRRDPVEVDVGGERHRTGVDREDRRAAATVGRLHRDAAIEAAGPQ